MALLGKNDSFNHGSDNLCEYIEKVDQIFSLMISMMQRKRLIFLSHWK